MIWRFLDVDTGNMFGHGIPTLAAGLAAFRAIAVDYPNRLDELLLVEYEDDGTARHAWSLDELEDEARMRGSRS